MKCKTIIFYIYFNIQKNRYSYSFLVKFLKYNQFHKTCTFTCRFQKKNIGNYINKVINISIYTEVTEHFFLSATSTN